MKDALRTTLLSLAIQLLLPLSASQAADTVTVGTNKQLFVDDFIVATSSGVTRELGQVTKANGGKPLFVDGWFYGTVLYDQQRFKLWYRKHGKEGYGLAESTDGIHFKKKADVTGINFAGDFTLSVEFDSHEKEAGHRYKGAYDAPGMAAGIAHSADGITWHPYNNGKPVTYRAADTYNQVLWDSLAQTYRLSTRTDYGTPGGDGEIRGTRSMTNADVRSNPKNWKLTRQWIFDREGKNEHQRRQVYAKTFWIYESVYFLILSVYEYPGDVSEGKTTDNLKRHERDVMNYYIATSRDGSSWDLRWVYAGQPMVPRGPDRAFDKDLIMPASTIVTHANKHWLYYGGANERHGTPEVPFQRDHAIGLATLRLDGFVSLRARQNPATVITKPLIFKGSTLSLNYSTADAGNLRVEIQDQAGKPIPGFSLAECKEIIGNQIEHVVQWKQGADVSKLAGQPIRLHFDMNNCDLYSFQFQPQKAAP